MGNQPVNKASLVAIAAVSTPPAIGVLEAYAHQLYAYTGDGLTSPVDVTGRVCELEAPTDPLYARLMQHLAETGAQIDQSGMPPAQADRLKNMLRNHMMVELARVALMQPENLQLSRDPCHCLERGQTIYISAGAKDLKAALRHFTEENTFRQFASLVRQSSGVGGESDSTGDGDSGCEALTPQRVIGNTLPTFSILIPYE